MKVAVPFLFPLHTYRKLEMDRPWRRAVTYWCWGPLANLVDQQALVFTMRRTSVSQGRWCCGSPRQGPRRMHLSCFVPQSGKLRLLVLVFEVLGHTDTAGQLNRPSHHSVSWKPIGWSQDDWEIQVDLTPTHSFLKKLQIIYYLKSVSAIAH